MQPGPRSRSDVIAALEEGRFDLLVIGAGAIGAATAWAAARAGARVAVVDRGDLGAATSSASTKLLHGGLRYLAMGDVRLVREAHLERLRTARVAPHLADPLRFIVPLRSRSAKLRLGVGLYGALSGWSDGFGGAIGLDEAKTLAPGLATERLAGALVYRDHRTDDARLVLAALDAAAECGAVVANHVEVVSLDDRVRLLDRVSGRELALDAGAIVNAAGPWVDAVRRLEDPAAAPSVRLSKGAHLLLEADRPWAAAVTSVLDDGRVAFAIPWQGLLMLGTTDTPYDGDPADVACDADDEAQILAEAAIALDLDPVRIRARFAGLRVLPLGDGATSGARRETVVTRGPRGMVSVAGGKLTTWLAIGDRVAAMAVPGFAPVPAGPVPSAVDPIGFAAELAMRFPAVPDAERVRLLRRYGRAATAILAGESEAAHAVAREWAVGPDDIARRAGLSARARTSSSA